MAERDKERCRRAAEQAILEETVLVREALELDAATETHLTSADLAEYLSRRPAPWMAEIVATHAEDCPSCAAALAAARRSRAARQSTKWLAAAAAVTIAILLPFGTPMRSRREPPAPPAEPRFTDPPVMPAARNPPAPAEPRYARAEWSELVQGALTSGALPPPRTELPRPRAAVELRGDEDPLASLALQPTGVAIDAQRPVFSWTAVAGAVYAVSVFDGDEEIAASETLDVERWTCDRDLPRGRTYTWQVEVTTAERSWIVPAPPMPEAHFRVLSAEEHEDLRAAKEEHPQDDLLLAVLCARYGLTDEASDHLRRLRARGELSPELERLIRAHLPLPSRKNDAQ